MFFVLFFLFTASVLAADPQTCDEVLRELHSLKKAELESSTRPEALVLGKAYQEKIHELADRLQKPVSVLEAMLENYNVDLPKIKKEVEPQVVPQTRAEIVDHIFRQGKNYEKVVKGSEEILRVYLQKVLSSSSFEGLFPKSYHLDDIRSYILFCSNPLRFLENNKDIEDPVTFFVNGFTTSDLELKHYKDNSRVLSTMPLQAIYKNDFLTLKALVLGFNYSPNEILLEYFEIMQQNLGFSIEVISQEMVSFLVELLDSKLELSDNEEPILKVLAVTYSRIQSSSSLSKSKQTLIILCTEILNTHPDLLEQKSFSGKTPIFYASGDILKLFIQYGANLDVKIILGKSLYAHMKFMNRDSFEILEPYFKAQNIQE